MRRGAPIETQRQQMRCDDCRHLFEADTPIYCRVEVFAAIAGTIRCPECGSAKVLFGQDRTLAEDRARRIGSTLLGRIVEWDRDGEDGRSARAIFCRMQGRLSAHGDDPCAHPHDLSDLGRCLQLLDRVPEWRPRLGEMAELSPAWTALAARWEALEAAVFADMGPLLERREAPQAAALLAEILAGAVAHA